MNLARLTTWIELAVSVSATPLVFLLLYTLITSVLNRGCKVFLTMNCLCLLCLTTSHASVAVYRLIFPGEWKAPDVVSNIPLFFHQLSYSSCTVTLFLITIERTIIGLKPNLYVDKSVSRWSLITVCVLSEILIALPSAMLMQDGPTVFGIKLFAASETFQKTSLLLFMSFDLSSLTMVAFSFFRSSQQYNKNFSKSTLGTRYQMREVIGLTRVFIPICCSSLTFHFTVITLAYFAFTDESLLDIFFTTIRFCCTTSAVVEPLLMLSRHRLLRKRLRLLLGLSDGERHQEVRDAATVSNVYFDAFNNALNKKRIGQYRVK